MAQYTITNKMLKKHPSICHDCVNARKPASEQLAQEGFVGCANHIALTMDPNDHNVFLLSMDEAAAIMYEKITAENAGTGWVYPARLKDNGDPGIMVNGVLLVKGCTGCPWKKTLHPDTNE